MKYFLGIVGIILGTWMVIKTEWIVRSFGTSAWAEQHFRTSGGTRLLYKLIGILLVFIAVLGMTGQLGGIILGLFSKLFGG